MKVGVAGYVATQSVAKWLREDPASLPHGFPGAPLFGTLIAALLERGHDVSVFTLSDDLHPGVHDPVIARGERLTVYYCPYRRHSFRPNGFGPSGFRPDGTPRFGIYLGRSVDFFRLERAAIGRAIAMARPDVVHAHWSYELAIAAIDCGFPYVITCHDSPLKVLKYFRNLYRLGRYLMALNVLKRATHLTAVSPYLRDEVATMAAAPIVVVPNALSSLLMDMGPRAPRQPHVDAPRLAMVSNGWIDLKNPKGGLAAFAIVRKSLPGATLHIYGAGYGPGGPAEEWARREKMDAAVSFHGELPHAQLLSALQTMDLLFHPSFEEAGSMIVTEAMALGLPIVGGQDSGAMPWLTGDGLAGIMTDVSKPAMLAAAVLDVIRDPARYQGFSAGGIERARAVFSADSVVRQYEAVYQHAIQAYAAAKAGDTGGSLDTGSKRVANVRER